MAIQFVSTGGRLVFKDSAGGSTLFDGLCGTQTSYRASSNFSTAQCQESAEEEKFLSLVTHEVSGTYNYDTTDTSNVFGVGDGTVYAIYLTQNGTTLFAGSVLVSNVEDNQGSRGTAETMSITASNNGSPTVGFGV